MHLGPALGYLEPQAKTAATRATNLEDRCSASRGSSEVPGAWENAGLGCTAQLDVL